MGPRCGGDGLPIIKNPEKRFGILSMHRSGTKEISFSFQKIPKVSHMENNLVGKDVDPRQ